jgi:hypothetical protein
MSRVAEKAHVGFGCSACYSGKLVAPLVMSLREETGKLHQSIKQKKGKCLHAGR